MGGPEIMLGVILKALKLDPVEVKTMVENLCKKIIVTADNIDDIKARLTRIEKHLGIKDAEIIPIKEIIDGRSNVCATDGDYRTGSVGEDEQSGSQNAGARGRVEIIG